MKELIKVIAFDADDTLWSNEPFFQEIEKQYTDLLKPYGTSEDISAALFQTEMNNLKYLGYGAKAFTISCLLYKSPSPRDISGSRMPSSA